MNGTVCVCVGLDALGGAGLRRAAALGQRHRPRPVAHAQRAGLHRRRRRSAAAAETPPPPPPPAPAGVGGVVDVLHDVGRSARRPRLAGRSHGLARDAAHRRRFRHPDRSDGPSDAGVATAAAAATTTTLRRFRHRRLLGRQHRRATHLKKNLPSPIFFFFFCPKKNLFLLVLCIFYSVGQRASLVRCPGTRALLLVLNSAARWGPQRRPSRL